MGFTAQDSSDAKLARFRQQVVDYAQGYRVRPPRLKYTWPQWRQFCAQYDVPEDEVFVDFDHVRRAQELARAKGTSEKEELNRLWTNHCAKIRMRYSRARYKGGRPKEREEEELELEAGTTDRSKPIAELTHIEIGGKVVDGEWTRVQGMEYEEECRRRGEIILHDPEEKEAELARRKFLEEPRLPFDQDSVKEGTSRALRMEEHLKRMLAEREQHK